MWTGPWAMAGINTRVVRRSNALQGWAYGRRFRYREVTGFGTGPAAPVLAVAASAGAKAAEAGLAFGPSRALLSRLLPAPGQGPGEKTRRTGYFRIQIHTRTSAGLRYLGTIEAQGDPGYAATSVMLGETALCLALDRGQLPDRAGVLTPATAMGAALATRLRSAGQTLAARQIIQLPARPRFLAGQPYGCALPNRCGRRNLIRGMSTVRFRHRPRAAARFRGATCEIAILSQYREPGEDDVRGRRRGAEYQMGDGAA